MSSSGVSSRIRGKPKESLEFRPPVVQVNGNLEVTLEDLQKPIELTREEELDEQLELRVRAKKVLPKTDTGTKSSATLMDYVLQDASNSRDIIAVHCTFAVALELQFVVLVLLRRMERESARSRLEVGRILQGSKREVEGLQVPNRPEGGGSSPTTTTSSTDEVYWHGVSSMSIEAVFPLIDKALKWATVGRRQTRRYPIPSAAAAAPPPPPPPPPPPTTTTAAAATKTTATTTITTTTAWTWGSLRTSTMCCAS